MEMRTHLSSFMIAAIYINIFLFCNGHFSKFRLLVLNYQLLQFSSLEIGI